MAVADAVAETSWPVAGCNGARLSSEAKCRMRCEEGSSAESPCKVLEQRQPHLSRLHHKAGGSMARHKPWPASEGEGEEGISRTVLSRSFLWTGKQELLAERHADPGHSLAVVLLQVHSGQPMGSGRAGDDRMSDICQKRANNGSANCSRNRHDSCQIPFNNAHPHSGNSEPCCSMQS